jgi:predicted metal-dependent HD superfamily phosphohydrolase
MLSTTASRNASVYLVQERWEKYVRPEHADWTWRMLVGLYGEPTRHYHTLEHVAACLREADGLLAMQPTLDRDRMELALIWHDAVYVPGQKENERLSAELLNALRDVLTVRDRNTVEYACTTIVATAAHDADWYGSDALSAVLDIDMSILGQDEATYDAYVKAVRKEFGFISDDAWRVGRGGFLAETLTRKKIYTLDVMRGRYEIRARENMRREAEGLAVP